VPEIIVTVGRADALHARPAAQVVRVVAAHASDVRISRGDPPGPEADARSITALLSLGVGRGETVRVRATGPDADAVLAAVGGILAGGPTSSGDPA
jgi:phosphotransferase system HPr (HPr) family protein